MSFPWTYLGYDYWTGVWLCTALYPIPGCTWDVPGLLVDSGILGQGYGCVLLYAIPGCTWDIPVLLGNPGILGQGYVCEQLHVCHSGMYLG